MFAMAQTAKSSAFAQAAVRLRYEFVMRMWFITCGI